MENDIENELIEQYVKVILHELDKICLNSIGLTVPPIFEEYNYNYKKTGLVLYRPHRGNIDDAMSEFKVFQSYEDLEQFIRAGHVSEDVKIELDKNNTSVADTRIGWKWTGYVMVDGYIEGMYTDEYDETVLIDFFKSEKIPGFENVEKITDIQIYKNPKINNLHKNIFDNIIKISDDKPIIDFTYY